MYNLKSLYLNHDWDVSQPESNAAASSGHEG